MAEIVLISLPIEDLRDLLKDAVRQELSSIEPEQGPDEILTRKELCGRLQVTEQTIINLERKGNIPRFFLGSSVRYNWREVLAALNKNGGAI